MKLARQPVVSITTTALLFATLTITAWNHAWLALGLSLAFFMATEISRGTAQGHQVRVAAYLAGHPRASAAQVSTALSLRPRAASNTLSNLVADGLAVRHLATAGSDTTTFSLRP